MFIFRLALAFVNTKYIHLCMAKKQMISIRLNKKLLQHLKQQPEVKENGLTDYVEDACKKKSKYKEPA